MLQVHGGSYLDEATGMRMSMLDADELTCVVPELTVTAGSTTAGIQVTPLTAMAQAWAEHMTGGMTAANAMLANSHIGAAYVGPGADIVMMHPIDPTVAGSANGASIEAKNYGMILAAMSQSAHDLGMTTSSSALVTALCTATRRNPTARTCGKFSSVIPPMANAGATIAASPGA